MPRQNPQPEQAGDKQPAEADEAVTARLNAYIRAHAVRPEAPSRPIQPQNVLLAPFLFIAAACLFAFGWLASLAAGLGGRARADHAWDRLGLPGASDNETGDSLSINKPGDVTGPDGR